MMDYPIGCGRCLMIILLVSYISRVDGRATAVPPDADQDFAAHGGGVGNVNADVVVDNASPPAAGPWWGARTALGSLGRETVNAAHRMLWGAGRFLLSAGGSVNRAWDAALGAALGLLRACGAAYGALAAKVADVPVVGYAAGGVAEAVRATLAAAESNARHDVQARRDAFAALAAGLVESGKRLNGGARAPAAAAEDAVRFPAQ